MRIHNGAEDPSHVRIPNSPRKVQQESGKPLCEGRERAAGGLISGLYQRPGARARTWRLLPGARRKRCRVAAACPLAISLSWGPAPYSRAAGLCSTGRAPSRRETLAAGSNDRRSPRAPALFVLFIPPGEIAFPACGDQHTPREGRSMHREQRRFDEVLDTLEQERQRVDEDLRRLVVAAAYLRTMLPERRRARRRRCSPRGQR